MEVVWRLCGGCVEVVWRLWIVNSGEEKGNLQKSSYSFHFQNPSGRLEFYGYSYSNQPVTTPSQIANCTASFLVSSFIHSQMTRFD